MHYHVLWLNMRSSEGEGLPLSPSGGGVKGGGGRCCRWQVKAWARDVEVELGT